jgi:hypothetical protein
MGRNYLTIEIQAINKTCAGVPNATIGQTQSGFTIDDRVSLKTNINVDVMVNNNLDQCSLVGTPINSTAGLSMNLQTESQTFPANAPTAERFVIPSVLYNPSEAWASAGDKIDPLRIYLNIDNSSRPGEEVYCGCADKPDPGDNLYCRALRGSGVFASIDHYGPTANATDRHAIMQVMQIPTNLESWWQVSNGLTYSFDMTESQIPVVNGGTNRVPGGISGFSDLLRSYLHLVALDQDQNNSDSYPSAGIPMSNTGLRTQGGNAFEWLREPPEQWHVPSASDHQSVSRENYEHFVKKVDFDDIHELPNVLVEEEDLFNPYYSKDISESATSVYILYKNGDLTIDPDIAWNIASGERVVIFVNGNVTISNISGLNELINVENGGFLAVIAKEDIMFDSLVGHDHYDPSATGNRLLYGIMQLPTMTNNETNANVEGVFIGRTITIQSIKDAGYNAADKKFIGAGTFVGHEGVNLLRTYSFGDFTDPSNLTRALNNYSPTEVFIYRPDFLINFPEPLMDATTIWQEVDGP